MIVVGTGGHALDVLSDGFIFNNYQSIYFYDSVNEFNPPFFFERYRVFNSINQLSELPLDDKKFILAIGKPSIRKHLYEIMVGAGLQPYTYTSQFAFVSPFSTVGLGNNIMPFASLFGRTSIGRGSLINSYTSIHHDTVIGEFCELSPGVRLLGKVWLGNNVQIGANATILSGIRIGHSSIIGAGAVVTQDIPDYCTAVGVPAKIIKSGDI